MGERLREFADINNDLVLTCEEYLTSVLSPQASCGQNNGMVWVTNPHRATETSRQITVGGMTQSAALAVF